MFYRYEEFHCTGRCGPLLNGRERRGDADSWHVPLRDGWHAIGHPFCWHLAESDDAPYFVPVTKDGLLHSALEAAQEIRATQQLDPT